MLGGIALNTARPEEDADPRSEQRSTGDLKSHAKREEEYLRQFPKRNYLQNDDRTEHGVVFPGSVLQERYEVTPSGLKIPRYEKAKAKAPTSKFAIPQPTPPEPSSIYERDPVLDQHARERAASASSVTYSNCRPQVKYVQAQGCAFEMATDKPTGAGMPLFSNPPSTDGSSERISRSSSRRQERADSHQDDVNISKARDFATAPRDDLSVPSLNIRKHMETPTRIPSPRSSPRSPSESLPVPPQTAENERKRDMEQAYTTSAELIKDERWNAPSPKAVKTLGLQIAGEPMNQPVFQPVNQPKKEQKRAIPAGRYEKALPPVLTPGAPETTAGVVVRPPFYDPMKQATLQWASPGITNSRPAGPWVSL